MNDLTPWEEINPPMASAPRHGLPSTCSARLEPATSDDFRRELTACLALVVPVGMTEEARRDWLTVAWGTLGNLPADVLAHGCAEARKVCDHPSKIVPAIIAATENWMNLRRSAVRPEQPLALPAPTRRHVLDRRGEPMSQADTDELNAILANLGATARYRPNGERYTFGDATPASKGGR